MAVRFGGSSAYTTTTGIPTGAPSTYLAWVYPESTAPSFQGIIFLSNAGGGERYFQFEGATVTAYSSVEATTEPAGAVTAGTWQQLAIVDDGAGNTTIYHSNNGGALTTFGGLTATPPSSPNRMRIGESSPGGGIERLTGRMAGLKIWSAALSASEVAAEFTQFAPVRSSNLVRYHRFADAATGATAQGGGAAALTVSGTAGNITTATDPPGVPETAGTAHSRTLTDTVGITDTTAAASTTSRSLTDPVGVTDTLAQQAAAARELADPVGITDPRTRTHDATRALVDPIGLVDVVGVLHSRELVDTVGITDTLSRQTDVARELVDPVGITDPLDRVHDAARELVDPVGITDEVAGEEIEPPGGEASTLTPDLYAVDLATRTATHRLPGWVRLSLSPVRNDMGAIAVDYPAGATGFDVLDAAVGVDPPRVLMVEMRLGGSTQGRRRGFLVQKRGDAKLLPAGVVRFEGHMPEWLLDTALVEPQPKTTANPKGELIVAGLTYGELLRLVVEQAQDRGDVLPGLTLSFTDTHDSNGTAWAHPITNLKIPPKTTVLDVAQKGVELGAGEFWVDPDLVLHAYNPDGRGTDRTVGGFPLTFAHTVNLRGHSQRESARDAGAAVLAAGGEGHYAWATNPTAEASLGFRIERAVDAGNIDDDTAIAAFAQGQAEVLGTGLAEYQSDVQLTPTGLRPLINYDVGDYAFAVVGTERKRRRIAQLAVEFTRDDAPRVTVAQNDLVSDALAALIRRMRRISGGDAVLGTSTPTPEVDSTIPDPPTGLVVDSEAQLDGIDYIAVVTAGWTPPTLNTDGSDLQDLAGFLVHFRYANEPGAWTGVTVEDPGDNTASFTADPGVDVVVRVAALDTSGHQSEWSAEVTHTTATDDLDPPTPSAPTTGSQLGVGFVTWDGVGSLGETMPADLRRAQVHLSASEVFTAGPDTLRTDATEGIPPGGGTAPILGLPPGSTWWAALVAEDAAGNLSAQTASVQLDIARAITDDLADGLIDAAKLAAGAVTAPAIAAEAVRTPHLSVAAFSDNLLPNGAMEDADLADPAKPAEWSLGTVTGTTADLTRDTTAGNVLSGTAAARVALGTASGTAQLLSATIPVSAGDVWYLEASARASRAVAGALSVRVLFGATPNPSTDTAVSGAQGLALGTAYAEVPAGGANLTVPTLVGGNPTKWMRLSVVVGGVVADSAPLDVWVDELRARRVVGTAEIADLAVSRAKIGNLAVGSAQVEFITAGQISAGTLSAVVTLSGEFRTAATGRRMVINGNGWEAYKADGTTLFAELDIATETMLVEGEFRTGTSGERIRILQDGTLRIYGSSGTDYGEIANDGGVWRARSRADGTGRRAYASFDPSGFLARYGTETQTRSSFSTGETYGVLTAGVVGTRVDRRFAPTDGTTFRAFWAHSTDGTPDGDIENSVLHYLYGNDRVAITAPLNDIGLRWDNTTGNVGDGRIYVTDGLGTTGSGDSNMRHLTCRSLTQTSSAGGKRDIRPMVESLPTVDNLRDLVRAVTPKSWKPREYDEGPRRVRINEVKEAVIPATPPDQVPTQFGLIAEELEAAAPELVHRVGEDGQLLTIAPMEIAAVAWQAAGDAHDRLDALEQALARLVDRLPRTGQPPTPGDTTP